MPTHSTESLKLIEEHILAHKKLKDVYALKGDTVLEGIHDNMKAALQSVLKTMLDENDTDMRQMAALHEAGVI